jgi:hypothetical protein
LGRGFRNANRELTVEAQMIRLTGLQVDWPDNWQCFFSPPPSVSCPEGRLPR